MKALLAGGWMTMVCAGSCGAADMPADAALAAERLRMVNAVVAMVRETARETGRATLAEPVLAALRRVEEEVLRDHVGHCVEHAIASGDREEQRRKIAELIDVLGRSNR